MKHMIVAVLMVMATLAFALPVLAQDSGSGAATHQDTRRAEMGRVVEGNKTIVFAPADTQDLEVSHLQIWGKFADAHPNIAKALAYNNSLMDSRAYLSKHRELSRFFREHPDIKQAMAQNPGNFVAIPPRPGE